MLNAHMDQIDQECGTYQWKYGLEISLVSLACLKEDLEIINRRGPIVQMNVLSSNGILRVPINELYAVVSSFKAYFDSLEKKIEINKEVINERK